MMKQVLTLSWLVIGSSGCVTSVEDDVSITTSPDEDQEYAKSLTKATQERTVIKDFETRYQVIATYLSPEFRGAFARRLERVYKQGQLQFEEADQKAGFFVSLRTLTDDRLDLANPHHWTVLLNTKDGPLKPVLVKRLSDKERWRAFFDSVSEWTTEYLVVFDTPSVNAHAPELVEKTAINLTFANADGQVNLSW